LRTIHANSKVSIEAAAPIEIQQKPRRTSLSDEVRGELDRRRCHE
jgi:hypothetical protein